MAFGSSYLSLPDFKNAAFALECEGAIAGVSDDRLKAVLVRASRRIDAYCGRSFSPDPIVENHRYDPVSRRIYVNQPPISEIVSYAIETAPGAYQAVTLTPSRQEATGQKTISYGALSYSENDNYLELASLATLGSLTPVLLALGLTEPQVRISYISFYSVPEAVQEAVAVVAAGIVNENRANKHLPAGLLSLRRGDQQVTRQADPSQATSGLPAEAQELLATYRVIRIC